MVQGLVKASAFKSGLDMTRWAYGRFTVVLFQKVVFKPSISPLFKSREDESYAQGHKPV